MSEKHCDKCRRVLGDSDNFCPRCGSKATEGALKPQRPNGRYVGAAIYGPPYSVKHYCDKCGYVKIESGLGSPHYLYCSNCGAKYGGCYPPDFDPANPPKPKFIKPSKS